MTSLWNDKRNVEIWRAAWAAYTNRALEAAGQPALVDHRSYKRQGIDKIPSVHLGLAASQMEKRGIRTNNVIGDLTGRSAAVPVWWAASRTATLPSCWSVPGCAMWSVPSGATKRT